VCTEDGRYPADQYLRLSKEDARVHWRYLEEMWTGSKGYYQTHLSIPRARAWMGVARSLGFDLKSQIQNPFFDKIGNIGSAHPLLMLAAALDEARSGDRVLVCGYGDGAEAVIFQVTPEIDRIKNRGKVAAMISSGRRFTNYPRYLSIRNLLEKEKRALRPFFAPAQSKREEKQNVRRYGKKCQKCGFVQYPMRRVCLNCGTKDEMEDYKLSDRGEIFSYTREYYIPFLR